METSFVAAVLIAAVLVYDRLGGNHELSRRLFQVGLAISLAFVVLSFTTAFIRTDSVEGGFSLGTSDSSSTTDEANRLATSLTVHYALGVVFLVGGLASLRRFHTIPLAFILGGVFLLFIGGGDNTLTIAGQLARLGLRSSQKVDVATFVTAVGGTLALLGYGLQLEREFALDSESDEDEADGDIQVNGA